MVLLRALLLGRARFETSEGTAIDEPGTKATAVFAFLSAQPDGRAHRGELADLLWEDADPAAARHALRQCLLRLRCGFGQAAEVLHSNREALWLDLARVEIDSRNFESATRLGDQLAAAEMWRGRFCEGLDVGAEPFEAWLRERRNELDRRAAEAFAYVAARRLAEGRAADAIRAARGRVSLDPYDEPAQAALIETCARLGRLGEANAAHAECVALFRRDLDAAPSDEVGATLALAKRVHIVGRRPVDVPVALPPPLARSPAIGARRRAPIWWAAAAAVLLLLAREKLVDPFVPADAASLEWVSAEDAYGSRQNSGADAVSIEPASQKEGPSDVPGNEGIRRAPRLEAAVAPRYPVGC